MGSIPLVALMGKPAPFENPTEQLERMQAIKSSQQQQQQSAQLFPGQMQEQQTRNQLGQQAVESGAMDIATRKGIQAAWDQVATPDPKTGQVTIDPQKLTSALATNHAAEAIPTIQKPLMDMQEGMQKLAAGKAAREVAEQDAAGDAGQAVLASGLDPNVKSLVFQHMHAAGYDEELQQIQQHLQQYQGNPQAEAGFWKSLIAASPKQQGLAAEAQKSQAAMLTAQTGQKKEGFEESMGGTSPEMIEMRDWLAKHPGQGPSDYGIAMKKIVPAFNFSLQNALPGGQGGQPSTIAKGLADNSIKWQDVVSNRTPIAIKQQLLSEVKSINPNYNSGDFSVEQAVKKDFTSGPAATNLTAFNTAIDHAKQLSAATDALNNGNVRALNAIGNQLGYQFGNDKTTNFNVIKNALSGEISKVFKGGQATDAEIQQVKGPFDAANSPQQLKGAINNAISLMNSKRDNLQKQYQAGTQAQPNFGNQEQTQQNTAPKFSVGQSVTIKGKQMTITAVHPDGSFDAK
jgi:hypothetical protein